MPTYVYACKNCGYRFEKYQSFSEDSLTTCPECSQETLRKVFDSVGIVFKGSGFYSTDSASTTTAGSAASPSSEGGSSESSSAAASTTSSGAGASSSGSSTGSASQPAAAAS